MPTARYSERRLVSIGRARPSNPGFAVGHCVVLRSGGPPMTIIRAEEDGRLRCKWVNGAAWFLPATLNWWGN